MKQNTFLVPLETVEYFAGMQIVNREKRESGFLDAVSTSTDNVNRSTGPQRMQKKNEKLVVSDGAKLILRELVAGELRSGT